MVREFQAVLDGLPGKSPEPLDVVGIVRKMQKVRKELNIE